MTTPSIGSISGTMTDGSSIVIGGSNFGSHNLDIEWLGGPADGNGNIEDGINDTNFSRTNWSIGIKNPVKYSTTKYHSGSKSLKVHWTDSSTGIAGFEYDSGGTFPNGIIYATFWRYFEFVTGSGIGGQLKQIRIRPDEMVSDRDGEIMISSWWDDNGNLDTKYEMVFCKVDSYDQCYPDSDPDLRHLILPFNINKWERIELYIKESSVDNVRDGDCGLWIHNQVDPVDIMLSDGPWIGSIKTRVDSGEDRMRWFHFQYWYGNNTNPPSHLIYNDDIYLQFGTRARIEIGDASTWATCKHLEIQIPTAWSDGSVTITVNRGSFGASDGAWLYVVDSTGVVNASGYAVTFGEGSPSQSLYLPPHGDVWIE